MKTTLTFSVCLLAGLLFVRQGFGQVLFSEDFETSPVTSFLNDLGGEVQLLEGPSTCGKASRGNVANFLSANVDFNSAQNPGYFLAVNPQVPCGGFYVATLHSQVLNFSSADSLVLSCRYFITNTLLWGAPTLQVNVKNGPSNYVVWSEFSAVGNWTNLTVGIPSTQIGATDSILIVIGGGEGVAIDDITITNIPSTSMDENQRPGNVHIFPNPAGQDLKLVSGEAGLQRIEVTDLAGKILKVLEGEFDGEVNISTAELTPGTYLIRVLDSNGLMRAVRFVKQ